MVLSGGDIKEICPKFSFDRSVLDLMYERLQILGDKLLQVEAWSEKKISAAKFLQQSCNVAADLCSKGVTAGDYVVLCCDKSILAYISLLATFYTGATAVIVPTQAPGDLFKLTKHAPIKAMFYDGFPWESIKESIAQLEQPPVVIVPLNDEHEVMRSMLKSKKNFSLYQVQDVENHIPLIMFTSGSSGDPKGVMLSDRALQRLGYSFDDEDLRSYLLISSFNWISSPISFISSIFKGYYLVLGNSKAPTCILDIIEKYQISGWTVGAQSLNYFIHEPSLLQRDLSSLKSVIIGGDVLMARVTKCFIEKVLKGKIGVKSLYGMTETGLLTTWRDVDLLNTTKKDSSGYLAPGVQVKIVDKTGEELSSGNVGEILVKSLSVMNGYWNTPAGFKEGLKDRDGFLKTGDVGYLDDDGYLYVGGRDSVMTILGDSKFPLSALEDVFKSHPLVLEAVVMVDPYFTSSKALAAFVVKKPGSLLTSKDLLQHIEDETGACTLLTGEIQFLDSLPKTVNYKIKRNYLEDLLRKKP